MNEQTQITPKTLSIELDTQTIVLKKLPLRKYAELLNALDELPKQFMNIDQNSTDKIMLTFPKIIAKCIPEVVKIINIGTEMSQEAIDELALDEITKLLLGVVEVNRYSEVYANLKKAFARPQ